MLSEVLIFFIFLEHVISITRVPVLVLPKIPQDMSNDLMDWFGDSQNIFMSLRDIMLHSYRERVQSLLDMPKKASNIFWWPFTQHKLVPEGRVTVIDSRCGENFTVFKVGLLTSDTGVLSVYLYLVYLCHVLPFRLLKKFHPLGGNLITYFFL